MTVIGHGQDQHVGLFADFDGADRIGASNGVRGIDRRGGDDFGGSQFHAAAGQRNHELHGLVPGRARVAIRCQGENAICFDDLAGGRVFAFGEPKGRAGQGDRDRIRFPQRSNICVRGLHKMICGRCAQFHRQRGAADVAELVGVDLEREPQRPGFGQDLARLLQVKGLVFAEDIHKGQRPARRVRLPPFLEHGQHRLANEIRVALRIIFVLGRDGVRTEEGNGKVERTLVVEGEQGFEQAQFGGGLQAVARFGFDSGRAVPEHPQQARAGLRHERFNGGRARLLDRGDDAASCGQDFEIGFACHLHLEFAGAVASPDDVRVRVDKTRHQDAVACIESRFVRIGSLEFRRRADRDDLFVAYDDCAVFDDAKRAEGMSALRTACQGEELGGGVDEHGLVSSFQ